jgi:hypothetical protein
LTVASYWSYTSHHQRQGNGNRTHHAGCRREPSVRLCFTCLAAEHGISEFDVREIAQVAVFREGFRVVARVCHRCNAAGETLVAPDPTCPS